MKYFVLACAIVGIVTVQAKETVQAKDAIESRDDDCFMDCLINCVSGSPICFYYCDEQCKIKDTIVSHDCTSDSECCDKPC